ncbi:MAG: hypothetical protein Q4B54_09905 [Coriobacteriales bacterium]|nr:hypothetical protein [Coriobacteriales bacterium]
MSKETRHIPMIALDGPSALSFYRDRFDTERQVEELQHEEDSTNEDGFYLSDEDIAYFMSFEEEAPQSFEEDTVYLSELYEHYGFPRLSPATIAKQNVYGGLGARGTSQDKETGLPSLTRSRFRQVSSCSTTSRDLKQIPYENLGLRPPSLESPLYLLSSGKRRRRVKNVNSRVCSQALPDGSFKRLGENVLVPSPELTFLLLARHLSLPELVAIGMELCGHYRLCGAPTNDLLNSRATVYGCEQLTTPTRLRNYVESLEGFYGSARALEACKHIEANSCSPMETVLYLLLCLPRTMGGYGLRRPSLNVKQTVSTKAGRVTFSKTLKPDLFWEDYRLDLEYDSDEYHSSAEALSKGARRTLALRVMHVDVISMTYDIMKDEEAFDVVAHVIARRLGNRLPPRSENAKARCRILRSALLHQQSYGAMGQSS